jgi:hypothetical protein
MTRAEFRAALATLGWSHREIARRLGCDPGLSIRWGRGGAPAPAEVAVWLSALVRAMERHPPPQDWRRRAA